MRDHGSDQPQWTLAVGAADQVAGGAPASIGTLGANSIRSASVVALHEHGGVGPRVTVTHRGAAAGKRSPSPRLDPGATPGLIERLGCDVLVEHPQVDRPRGPMRKEFASRFRQQARADAGSLQIAPYVQIVDESSPSQVVVEDRMSESDDFTATIGDHRGLVSGRRSQTTRPDLEAISDDITVEVGVQVDTAIVASPTISVKRGHGGRIFFRRLSIPHRLPGPVFVLSGISHARLLLDSRIGTVPKPPDRYQTSEIAFLDVNDFDDLMHLVNGVRRGMSSTPAPPTTTTGVHEGATTGTDVWEPPDR